MTYATMFDAEIAFVNEGYLISWKALSGAYEAAHVRYLLASQDHGSRVVSLVYDSNEGYQTVQDATFEEHEEAMLRFLESQYQEDCDLFEGEFITLVRKEG